MIGLMLELWEFWDGNEQCGCAFLSVEWVAGVVAWEWGSGGVFGVDVGVLVRE